MCRCLYYISVMCLSLFVGNRVTDGDNNERRKVNKFWSYAYSLQPSLLTLLIYHYYIHRSISYGVRLILCILHEFCINHACM